MTDLKEDETKLVREVARSVLWGIIYHEQELTSAHEIAGTAQALIQRIGLPVDPKMALEIYEETEDEPVGDTTKFAQYIFGRALSSVQHHEKEMAAAHRKLGPIKAIIHRGGYEVSLEEIDADERRSYEERKARETE